MATKIMKSANLPASRYKDDWLSHRNLKNHSSDANYNTRAFAKSLAWGHLCPGLPWKIGVPTIFRTSRFSVTLFFSLTRRGFKIQQIFPKFAKTRGCNDLSHFTIFSYFFAFLILTWRRFRIQQILSKVREIVVATICRTLRFFVTSLLFSIDRRGRFRF